MAKNNNLNNSRRAKDDEFYTQISDIEKELAHYKEHFKDKIIFCNCDDPEWSNFWKYFSLKFDDLGLKKLISTHYDSEEPTYKLEMFKENGENKILKTTLKQNGDFRSPECIQILKESDIIITNPPFSLFREYMAQLIKYDKKFLIIGNKNSINYMEVFPLFKDNKIWLGFNSPSEFSTPDGTITKKVSGLCRWFTNLDITKRHEELILYKKYKEEDYPKYDNYDAINVNKVSEIPCDYEGIMGVPITFIDNYNPKQFRILGITDRQNSFNLRHKKYTKEDANDFNDLNAHSVLFIDGKYKSTYARIFIEKVKEEDSNGD